MKQFCKYIQKILLQKFVFYKRSLICATVCVIPQTLVVFHAAYFTAEVL